MTNSRNDGTLPGRPGAGRHAEGSGESEREVDPGALAPGTQIRDWIVRGRISAGGFGTVYRVEHATQGRPAAMKVLHAEMARERGAVQRFEREAHAVNMIRHENVIDIYEFGQLDDGRPFFVMELLEGADLDAHLQQHGRASAEEALDILAPLCDALGAAHDKGVIHRDLKPSNVFLAVGKGGARRVVLLDFGVAKLTEGSSDLTTSREIIGTPESMAPEQIRRGTIDARTDVYALGALAFELLTGRPPFEEESPYMLQRLHLDARRPRPSERGASPVFDTLITRAMDVDPAQRPATAAAFLAAFRAAADARRSGASELRRALGVHVEARVSEAALIDADDALLAEIDRVLSSAQRHLEAHGFQPAFSTSASVLCVLLLPDAAGDADATARRAGLKAAGELARTFARSAGDARVRVTTCVHVDGLLVSGGRARGGDLLQLAGWVLDADVAGLYATPAAIDGAIDATGLSATPAAEAAGRLRLDPQA